MDVASLQAAQALSLAGLVAATGEYAAMIRRRADARRELTARELAAETGLQALVRISLAADEARQRHAP